MKTKAIFITFLAVVAVVALLLRLSRDNNPNPGLVVASASRTWETKTDAQGQVEVTVTPVNLAADYGSWQFSVTLETHSVELDYDLTKIATLRDNKSNEYQPLAWEGDPPGGHHREGQLLFAPIKPWPSTIELEIRNIDNITRLFKWNL